MPKFGRKVPHLIDATRVPVSRSNGQRSGLEADGGIPCGPLAEQLVEYKTAGALRYLVVT